MIAPAPLGRLVGTGRWSGRGGVPRWSAGTI